MCAAESATGGGVKVFISFGVVPFAFGGGAGFALGIFGSFGTGHYGQYIHWMDDEM